MAKQYSYQELKINQLILDDENPRFASSILVSNSDAKVSQQAIIEHLLKYADIHKIAQRINSVHELHGAELITCYLRDSEYVVLEGNRRVCACKLLLDRALIPDEHKSSFPFLDESTKENIEEIMVIVYPDRETVQAYLSDRHIAGVKKWSALEKNNYYMNLFQKHKDIHKVKEFTSDTIGVIRKSIIKYQFFMDVYQVIREKHNDIEIEKLIYLPMVDRFMDLLVSDDSDVGLGLYFDEATFKYNALQSKQDVYTKILMCIGEAFLLRKDKKFCLSGELPKITSTEIKNTVAQKALILDNLRIPGLIDLICEYKKNSDFTNSESAKPLDIEAGNYANEQNSGACEDYANNAEGNASSQNKGEENDAREFIPDIKFHPKKTQREFLCFYKDDVKNWRINEGTDIEEKIKYLIYDLSKLSVYKHPCACAMLYRALLEISTKLFYQRTSSLTKKYNESDLSGNIVYLINNSILRDGEEKRNSKRRAAMKIYTKDDMLIKTLNLYIHYGDPVDEQLLLSSWNTMKTYITECLKS